MLYLCFEYFMCLVEGTHNVIGSMPNSWRSMHLRLHTSILMVHVKDTQFEVGSWQVADFEGLYFIGQVCHGELNGAGLVNYTCTRLSKSTGLHMVRTRRLLRNVLIIVITRLAGHPRSGCPARLRGHKGSGLWQVWTVPSPPLPSPPLPSPALPSPPLPSPPLPPLPPSLPPSRSSRLAEITARRSARVWRRPGDQRVDTKAFRHV